MKYFVKGFFGLLCLVGVCFGVRFESLVEARKNNRVKAFLDVIAYAEGTFDAGILGYSLRYPYQWFRGYDKHPGVIEFKRKSGELKRSSAAGRYMFLQSTWNGLEKQYGFADFKPFNQDLGAIALLYENDAVEDIVQGRFAQAINKTNKTWAPFPGAPYGQTNTTMAELQKFFNDRSVFYARGGVA